MRVGDLIEELRCYDEDAEVRFASQPSWPFEYSICEVVAVEPDDDEELGEIYEAMHDDTLSETDLDEARELYAAKRAELEDAPAVVYLAEGTQLAYLPGSVSRKLGWR
jgi:hypothetical protein